MSAPRRKLVRRIRRKAMGGRIEVRVYDDDTMRVRVDHPSNSAEVEMAMAGMSIDLARRLFGDAGYALNVGPIRWRDDPEPA